MISRVWSLVKKQFLKKGLKWSGGVQLLAIMTLAVAPALGLPEKAQASTSENKSRLVFEIKNLQNFEIPENLRQHIPFITDQYSDNVAQNEQPTESAVKPEPQQENIIEKQEVKKTVVAKVSLPPKAEDKIYMHEPEIREYVCPKLGDRCDTFIAILKAENGTHECTRDNRGLNRNGSVDVGLAQINWSKSSPYSFEQLQDCKFNLDIALRKIEYRGFQPWVAYNKGTYKKHLNLN
jgi:hypothetical protein